MELYKQNEISNFKSLTKPEILETQSILKLTSNKLDSSLFTKFNGINEKFVFSDVIELDNPLLNSLIEEFNNSTILLTQFLDYFSATLTNYPNIPYDHDPFNLSRMIIGFIKEDSSWINQNFEFITENSSFCIPEDEVISVSQQQLNVISPNYSYFHLELVVIIFFSILPILQKSYFFSNKEKIYPISIGLYNLLLFSYSNFEALLNPKDDFQHISSIFYLLLKILIPCMSSPNIIFFLSYVEICDYFINIFSCFQLTQTQFYYLQRFFIRYFSFSFNIDENFSQFLLEKEFKKPSKQNKIILSRILVEKRFIESSAQINMIFNIFFHPSQLDLYAKQEVAKVFVNIFDHNPDYFPDLCFYCIQLITEEYLNIQLNDSHDIMTIFNLSHYFFQNQESNQDISSYVSSFIYPLILRIYFKDRAFFYQGCGKDFLSSFILWVLENDPYSQILEDFFPTLLSWTEEAVFKNKVIIAANLIILFSLIDQYEGLFNLLNNQDIINSVIELWFFILDSSPKELALSILQIISSLLINPDLSKSIQIAMWNEKYKHILEIYINSGIDKKNYGKKLFDKFYSKNDDHSHLWS
ncbi:hypothetical protein IKN40_04740 [bacterium]|nr:hypothetical protein [bacterium]